ncbi:lysine 2,3-aminomutase [Methylocystis echinoides]|uniref:Lysine 2,3-aminomutase n=1 Tax=Methylocystis echinoides TaxID=29468 RepID=A0A9W6LRJ8_9HYPH|nr:lysine 2,3-aminomutase [Methylocystis echinoides]
MSALQRPLPRNSPCQETAPAKKPREHLTLTSTKTLRSLSELAGAGLAADAEDAALRAVAARYSVAVTPEVATLIDRNDPADPIARQFLPDARELTTLPQELADPIGDDAHSPVAGVVHRYPDRVLLKLLTVCPVYCRFCFRRETVGAGKGALLGEAETTAALDYIARTPQIFEVILTGGDPLMLSARRLTAVARRLAEIEHVRILRVHSRAPTAAPDLVSPERLAALKESGKALYLALHVNHARELSAPARAAIATLRAAGVTLLSQTVLLAGVNDDAGVLETLMRDLLALGVKPYYLHHPDLAPGTRHFRLNIEAGKRLYAELSRRLTGIGVPAYVLDIPGGFGKTPVMGLEADGAGGFHVTDRTGRVHVYRDHL